MPLGDAASPTPLKNVARLSQPQVQSKGELMTEDHEVSAQKSTHWRHAAELIVSLLLLVAMALGVFYFASGTP